MKGGDVRRSALKPITVQLQSDVVIDRSILRPISLEPRAVAAEEPVRDRRKQVIAAGSAGVLVVSLVGGALVLISKHHADSKPAASTIGHAQTGAVPPIIATEATNAAEATPTATGRAAATPSDDPTAEPYEADDLTQIAGSNLPSLGSAEELTDTSSFAGELVEPVDDESDAALAAGQETNASAENFATDEDYGFFDSTEDPGDEGFDDYGFTEIPDDFSDEDLDDYGFIEIPDNLGGDELDDGGFVEIPDDLGAEDFDDDGFTDPVDESDGNESDGVGSAMSEQPDAPDTTGIPDVSDEQDNSDSLAADEPDGVPVVPTPAPENQPDPTPPAPGDGTVETTPTVADTEQDPDRSSDDEETEQQEPMPPPAREATEPVPPSPVKPQPGEQPTPSVTDGAIARTPDDAGNREDPSGGILDAVRSDTLPADIQLTLDKSVLSIEFKVTEAILKAGADHEPINWIIRLWNDTDPDTEIYSVHITRIDAEWSATVLEVDESATEVTEIDASPGAIQDSLRFSFPLERLPRLTIPFSWTAIAQGNDTERFWQDALTDGEAGNWSVAEPRERIRYLGDPRELNER